MQILEVAAIQPKPIGNLDDKANLLHALELLEQAVKQNVHIVCFPEYYPWHGEDELIHAAKKLNIYIIAGLSYMECGKKYNTATLISNEGKIVGRQKKANLGLLEIKHFGFSPGPREYKVFHTELGKIGLGVCVDFWGTQEAGRSMAKQGVDIVFNPSFFFIFQPIWKSCILTRVLDNFFPVVAVDMARFHFHSGDLSYSDACGSGSFVVQMPSWKDKREFSSWWKTAPNPMNWITKQLGSEEGILFCKIDLRIAQQYKAEWYYRLGLRENMQKTRAKDYMQIGGLDSL